MLGLCAVHNGFFIMSIRVGIKLVAGAGLVEALNECSTDKMHSICFKGWDLFCGPAQDRPLQSG